MNSCTFRLPSTHEILALTTTDGNSNPVQGAINLNELLRLFQVFRISYTVSLVMHHQDTNPFLYSLILF